MQSGTVPTVDDRALGRGEKKIFILFFFMEHVSELLPSELVLFLLFQCSVSCGEGISQRITTCRFPNGRLSETCAENSKPITKQPCNLQPCPRWTAGDWGKVRECIKIIYCRCSSFELMITTEHLFLYPNCSARWLVAPGFKCGLWNAVMEIPVVTWDRNHNLLKVAI